MIVRPLPEASAVSPFNVTAPVPVLKVPLEADWSKLPAPPVKDKLLPEAIAVSPLSEIAPVPVEKVPTPLIAKLPLDWV